MATDNDEKLELHAVEITPNNCPLGSPLTLKLSFTTKVTLNDAVWDIKVFLREFSIIALLKII